MHIPDGFISPKLYIPAYIGAGAVWAIGLRRLRRRLRAETIPLLGVMTAVTFVMMSLSIPLPGGTSVHASGIAILTVLFGVWTAFLSLSLVLLLQALLLGAGGITSLPVNALAMGLCGSLAAAAAFRLLRGRSESLAVIAAGSLSVLVAAALIALALGIQPRIAHGPDGSPRFFPFGLSVTLPAVLIPHLVAAAGEGVLTWFIYRFVRSYRPDDAESQS